MTLPSLLRYVRTAIAVFMQGLTAKPIILI